MIRQLEPRYLGCYKCIEVLRLEFEDEEEDEDEHEQEGRWLHLLRSV
ncbi:MAG: hypothetical protein AB1705_13825 [Verrucomicrobiota bacterium]